MASGDSEQTERNLERLLLALLKIRIGADRRCLYTPLFAGVEWNVQNVLLEDVERIEVVRGLGGTIWGSNVVKGVINTITKNAKDTRGAVTTTSANQRKQQGTSVYSMSSCLWGKWLLQLSKTTE